MFELLPTALADTARDVFIGLLALIIVGLVMELAYRRVNARYEAVAAVEPFERVDAWAGIDRARQDHPVAVGSFECEQRAA